MIGYVLNRIWWFISSFLALGVPAQAMVVLSILILTLAARQRVKSWTKAMGNSSNSLLRRAMKRKKPKDIIVMSKDQILTLLSGIMLLLSQNSSAIQQPEVILPEILLLASQISDQNKTKDDPKIKGLTKDDKVYEDAHFCVYHIPYREFIVFCKDIDDILHFEISTDGEQVYTEKGAVFDVHDIRFAINGKSAMRFEERYI
jgi:hypothetical protein